MKVVDSSRKIKNGAYVVNSIADVIEDIGSENYL